MLIKIILSFIALVVLFCGLVVNGLQRSINDYIDTRPTGPSHSPGIGHDVPNTKTVRS